MPEDKIKGNNSKLPPLTNNSLYKNNENFVTVIFDNGLTSSIPLTTLIDSLKKTPEHLFIKSKPQNVILTGELSGGKIKNPSGIAVFVCECANEDERWDNTCFFEDSEFVTACFCTDLKNTLVVLIRIAPIKDNDEYKKVHNEIIRYFDRKGLIEDTDILMPVSCGSDPGMYWNPESRVWGEPEKQKAKFTLSNTKPKKEIVPKTPIQVEPITTVNSIPKQTNIQTADAQLLSVNDAAIRDIASERGIMYNELTQDLEDANGTPLNNRDINNITLQARSVNKNISDAAVTRVLYSNLTPCFHPFPLYINSIKDKPLVHGTIDKFLSCLILDDHHPDYLKRIVLKWFGGLMGTLMGSYSVMTLVFVGRQGNGKTVFFRVVLLPPALRRYYCEGEVLNDKDGLARMCSNFIMNDDELTIKNKQESSDYKKVASAEYCTYRKPYARIDETRKRTAVLCGSSNEQDVISDCTGNRRIIPVRLKHIDHEKLTTINIDDFYRELLEMHKDNPTWWHLSADDIAFMNQDTIQNTAVDEFEERVSRWTASDPDGHVSTTDVSRHLAAYDGSYRPNIPKLGRALTKVYGSSIQAKINGVNVKGYKIKLISNDGRA